VRSRKIILFLQIYPILLEITHFGDTTKMHWCRSDKERTAAAQGIEAVMSRGLRIWNLEFSV